jgi:hypothetical protein
MEAQTGHTWKDTDLLTAYANALRVLAGREEIVLLFGTEGGERAPQAEAEIQLLNRIIMSPFGAKRLSIQLAAAVSDYESRCGPLEWGPAQQRRMGQEISGGVPGTEARDTSAKANLLIQLIRNLPVKCDCERSFKILDKTLLWNRCVFGVNKKLLGGTASERLLDLCQRMDMPRTLLTPFAESLSNCNFVLFGYEESETKCVYKVYLEYYDKYPQYLKNGAGGRDPFLLLIGYKWEVSNSSRTAVTKYTWYPWLSAEEIGERVSRIYDGCRSNRSVCIADEILRLALRKANASDVLYLDVCEDEYRRHSFDINLYEAGLTMQDLADVCLKMCRCYSIPHDEFDVRYANIRNAIFGHLSGGVDREGRDFLSIYYEDEVC